MAEIVWESPPEDRRHYKRNRYLEELRTLCLNPLKWGRVDLFDSADRANSARNNLKYAVTLRRYRVPDEAKDYNFDLRVRKLPDGSGWGLYGMAVPKEMGGANV